MIAQSDYAKALLRNWDADHIERMIFNAVHELVAPCCDAGAEREPERSNLDTAGAKAGIAGFRTSGARVQLVLFGEDHTDERDHARSLSFIRELDDAGYPPSLVVFERGMADSYRTGGLLGRHTVVREDNLADNVLLQGLTHAERSMLVAGYLAACIATTAEPVNAILFYGEEHRDILDRYFDFFARHTDACFLLSFKRRYYVVPSAR